MSSRDADCERAIAETARLTVPSVLGFYTHFEATEIFAIRNGETTPLNVFSVLVAEERHEVVSTKPSYLGQRIRLKALNGWTFGIQQSLKPISELVPAFHTLHGSGVWRPSGETLYVDTLMPVPTQFVPPDSTVHAPWNHVLKNNFWNGSYVIEWSDPKKTLLKPFFDDPPALQELSNAIQQSIPIGLASLSDRLGSVVVQLPVTVIMASFGRNRLSGASIVDVAWHAKAVPRDLRASCEMQFDDVISGYVAGSIQAPQTVLPMPAGEGMLRGIVWDDQHQVVLAASGSTGFITTIAMNMRMLDPEPRVFTLKDKDGQPTRIRVGLSRANKTIVGSPVSNQGEKWTRQRMYRDEAARLAAERKFVQYRVDPGRQFVKHEEALQDVRHLLNQYGEEGAWLWDPYLSADDVLNTLFYCSHWNADLRALTEGNAIPAGMLSRAKPQSIIQRLRNWVSRCVFRKKVPVAPSFVEVQREILDSSKSNLRGLRLEFRIRVGQTGWAFHDRFLIFPKVEGGALAWSLGTSVNSLGRQHHILQRVDDGQLVADAFNDLWNELDQPEHVVWKTP